MSLEIFRDAGRGDLVVLAKNANGALWKVAPAADPDMSYWIAREYLSEAAPPTRPSRPKRGGRPSRPPGCAESEPWFGWLWERGTLKLKVHDGHLEWVRGRWKEACGEELPDPGSGFLYVDPPPRHPAFAHKRHCFRLEFPDPGPGVLPPWMKASRKAKGVLFVTDGELCWELVAAGFRLGRERRV